MPLPIFHISCFQEFVDEIEKAFVGNLLPKQAQEDSVVNGIERSHNSIPYSTTHMKRAEQRLKSLTPLIHCSVVALR